MEYTVKICSMLVTRWNEEQEDWSGDTFIKSGYILGTVKQNGLHIVKEYIRECFDVDADEIYLDCGELYFSVTEDEQARQDENGKFLVDYRVKLEATQSVEIEDYK